MLIDFTKSLQKLEEAFKADTKSVLFRTSELENSINNLKKKSLTDLNNSSHLKNTTKLIEKLSIINEFKLNLIKEFSTYNIKKK